MSELTVTKENFETEVLSSDVPVLLDFWASWCGPCKMLSPIVAAVAAKYEGKLKVGKINVDEQPELAAAFRVSTIPLVIVMNGGQVMNSSIGYAPQERIEALLDGLGL